jgi:hypothetical protein
MKIIVKTSSDGAKLTFYIPESQQDLETISQLIPEETGGIGDQAIRRKEFGDKEIAEAKEGIQLLDELHIGDSKAGIQRKKITVKAFEYIIAKQIQWALNHDIPLKGSKDKRGRPAYSHELNQNLFEPLDLNVRKSFEKGDGNEISESTDGPAKMQAVHSSSALSVNIFQYWQRINKVSDIAAACGFCEKGSTPSLRIMFEDKYPIDTRFKIAPNIDIVFQVSDSSQFKRFAVECKFSEAYSLQKHKGLKTAYIDFVPAWSDIPSLYNLAKSISPDDNHFIYLHAAQLIKHILGLKKECGKTGFKLLYLWYDVLGREGATHRNEIEQFIVVAKADGVIFDAMSYQELILLLAKDHRQQHPAYIKYLTERYL